MSGAYYNEFDPKAAAWLRELIRQGHIAPGDVDERDIRDVTPSELVRYTQCHFFAGIGVWSYALRSAGWPDDRPVWTGSCPCQPFSPAGAGAGFADERHLWPFWHYLISECRPAEIYGEQVADGGGEVWLDLVLADLEGSLYAAGPVDICAAGVGSPNIRQRLYFKAEWMDYTANIGHERTRSARRRWDGLASASPIERMGSPIRYGLQGSADPELFGAGRRQEGRAAGRASGASGGLAIADDAEWRADLPRGDNGFGSEAGWDQDASDLEGRGDIGRVAHPDDNGQRATAVNGVHDAKHNSEPCGSHGGLADANGGDTSAEWEQRGGEQRLFAVGDRNGRDGDSLPGPVNGFWGNADWILCRDPDGPAWRPVEPSTFPLAHGAPARVGRLRGYGNAINAKVAQAVIEVSM